jgi:hypothetical protein
MISLVSMESLLCWRPRYARLGGEETGLKNQVAAVGQHKGGLAIVQHLGGRVPAAEEVVDPAARDSAWYLPAVSRGKAEEILATSAPGAFLLRSSTASAFALSVLVSEDKVQHHLLVLCRGGVGLRGSTKVFPRLSCLVTHLSIMRETLPCCLLLGEAGAGEREEEQQDIVDIDSDKEMEDCVRNLKQRLEE